MGALQRIGKLTERLWRPGQTLSQLTVQSGIWVFGLRVPTRLAKFTRTIALARLPSPDGFGLMGLALLSISTLESFTTTGFITALVQQEDDICGDLDTDWTVSVLRGPALASAVMLGAPYLARFFDAPHATPVMRAVAISVFLSGPESIGVVYSRKDLVFGKPLVLRVSGVAADFVMAVVSAVLLHSVLALVLALPAERLVRLALSDLLHPYRPRPRLERSRALRLCSYGKWVSLSSIPVFIGAHGDNAVVGRLIGKADLGIYQLSYRLSQLAVTETTYVIETATLPAYAKLQGQSDRLRCAYCRIASAGVALSMLVSVAIIAWEWIS